MKKNLQQLTAIITAFCLILATTPSFSQTRPAGPDETDQRIDCPDLNYYNPAVVPDHRGTRDVDGAVYNIGGDPQIKGGFPDECAPPGWKKVQLKEDTPADYMSGSGILYTNGKVPKDTWVWTVEATGEFTAADDCGNKFTSGKIEPEQPPPPIRTLELECVTDCTSPVQVGEKCHCEAKGGKPPYKWIEDDGETIEGPTVKWTIDHASIRWLEVSDSSGQKARCELEVVEKHKPLQCAPKNVVFEGEAVEFDVTGGEGPYTWSVGKEFGMGQVFRVDDKLIKRLLTNNIVPKDGVWKVYVTDSKHNEDLCHLTIEKGGSKTVVYAVIIGVVVVVVVALLGGDDDDSPSQPDPFKPPGSAGDGPG